MTPQTPVQPPTNPERGSDARYVVSVPAEALLPAMEMQDGGLIEVCVTSASYEEWVATFNALVASGFPMVVKYDDAVIPAVMTTEFFADDDDHGFALSVETGRQRWTTSFYSLALIDFQGDPRDIRNDSDIEDVRTFMQIIADATGRTVRMVPETFQYETATAYMLTRPATSDR